MKKIFVVKTANLAALMQPILGDDWVVTCPGAGLVGILTDCIVFSRGWDEDYIQGSFALEGWVQRSLFTRIVDKTKTLVVRL